MATRAGKYIANQLSPFALVIEWKDADGTALLANDDGAWVLTGHYNDKSLHVYGTFGGATVTFQGSNEDTPTNAVGLRTPSETAISITSSDIRQVLENPLFVRPKVTGGDGTTALTVRLVCRH